MRRLLPTAALFLFGCFIGPELPAQDFLTLLKTLDTNTKNFQTNPDRLEFVKARYDKFNFLNFLKLYNHAYEKHYTRYEESIIEYELLRDETSEEYKKYNEVNIALKKISDGRLSAIGPLYTDIQSLGGNIERSKYLINYLREKAESVVNKEEAAMKKRINGVNTMNAINSFVSGFTGNSDNLVYQVPPSSALVWTTSYDFTDEGEAVPAEMRKLFEDTDLSSKLYIRRLNNWISLLTARRTELQSKQKALEKEYEAGEQLWSKKKSDFIAANFTVKQDQTALLEAALAKKYTDWYNSELKQIRDTFTRKFGEASTDLEFVEFFTEFANSVKIYNLEMRSYSDYKRFEGKLTEEKMTYSLKDVSDLYDGLKAKSQLKDPKFSKIVESMGNLSSYAASESAKSILFTEYIQGKSGKYFYYVRPFLQAAPDAPVRTIESAAKNLRELKNTVFANFSEQLAYLARDCQFDNVEIITADVKSDTKGIENIHTKNLTLRYEDSELDAAELEAFNSVVGLQQLTVVCECKIKDLSKVQPRLKFRVVANP